MVSSPNSRRRRFIGLLAAALGLSAGAATEAVAAPVPSSLVNTIDTSRWSPPSPDPSGLAYDANTNRLLVSDSEVDEMSIYAGANYYEATLGGSLLRTTNTLAFSHEPAGLAFDSGGRLFFSDDDQYKVFQIALGANASFDAGDSSTSFSTTPYGIVDPEGTAYDKVGDRLFVADGDGNEIWQIQPVDGIFGNGNDQVQHFDTTVLGVTDPETVEFNPDSGTLFTIGTPGSKIAEVTTSGALVSEIDTSYLPLVHPAGMAYAPRSTDPAKKSFYIADRKVDNDNHPTENDGAIYEVAPGSAGGGTPPGDVRVAASSDDAEEAASGSTSLTSSDLEFVTDDSLVQTVGVRFPGLGIPAGAKITSAYIQFVADESQSEATSLTLKAQAADNAATFTSASFNVSSRPRTAASASWAPVAWTAGEAGSNQRTPDLTPVVQEVANRGGWASGNAMAFIVTGSGHRTAVAFDGNAAQAPVLHVEFLPPSGASDRRRCVDSRARTTRTRIGPARVGKSGKAFRRSYKAGRRKGRVIRYCLRNKAKGRFYVGSTKKGTIEFVASTVRRHGTKRYKPGKRAKGNRIAGAWRIDKGLFMGRGKKSRVVYGVRRGKVTFVATVSRTQARHKRALVKRLRALSLVPKRR